MPAMPNHVRRAIAQFVPVLAVAALAHPAAAQEVGPLCSNGQTPMCYGERALCSISPGGDLDVYQFIGEAGDQVSIVLAGLSNDLDPRIDVYGPDSVWIDGNSCSAPSYAPCSVGLALTLVQRGMHTILISDAGLNNTGNYALDLQRFPPVAAPWIDYGESRTIALEHASDRDLLQFAAEAGTHLRITFEGLTNDLDPRVTVFDEAGLPVPGGSAACSAPSYDRCSGQIVLAPFPASGTFSMVVEDWGWDNTGSVDVTLTCVIGNCPPPDPAGPLGSSYCAQTVNSTGNAAVISARGSPFVADNDVLLVVSDAPPGKLGLFFVGGAAGDLALPNSWGPLCVRPPLSRRPLVFVCNDGDMRYRLDLETMPMIAPGTSWYFQSWFRDPAGTPPNTSNTSDGLQIDFQ